jgi:hypothetical protein
MSKLGDPAILRPDMCYVACLRCKTSVGIENMGSSVRVHYDIAHWHRSVCCCLHLGGPMSCCHFGELRRVIGDLPIPH